jgi:hypothetical protein
MPIQGIRLSFALHDPPVLKTTSGRQIKHLAAYNFLIIQGKLTPADSEPAKAMELSAAMYFCKILILFYIFL